MMDFIMVPTIMAIITLGIYKLFELFVCKKERLMLMAKGKKKEKDEETGGAAEMPEEAAAQPAEPMAEKHDPLPDLDDDFGGQKVSSSSLIDIEADDK